MTGVRFGYSPLFMQLGIPPMMIQDQANGLPGFALVPIHAAAMNALGGGLPLLGNGSIPPMLAMMNPAMMLPLMAQIAGAGYASDQCRRSPFGGEEQVDLRDLGWAGNKKEAKRMENALKNNPRARAAFEESIGGRIVDFGKDDGKMTIERFPMAAMPSFPSLVAVNPSAAVVASMLGGMNNSVDSRLAAYGIAPFGQSASGGSNNPFLPLMMMGLGGTLGQLIGGDPASMMLGAFGGGLAGNAMSGGGNGFSNSLMMMGLGGTLGQMVGGNPLSMILGALGGGLLGNVLGGGGGGGGGAFPNFGGGFPFFPNFGGGFPFFPGFDMLGGAGMGSLNPLAAPGSVSNTNPAYEAGSQAQISAVLNDPSLSVEDKVMMMLALIMKKMDDDIERQMQYINALQNQQANRKGGGGKKGGQGSPSVDVEMQKLQRMITKRAQIFEMASNIMKKYDDTARAAIQKINS